MLMRFMFICVREKIFFSRKKMHPNVEQSSQQHVGGGQVM